MLWLFRKNAQIETLCLINSCKIQILVTCKEAAFLIASSNKSLQLQVMQAAANIRKLRPPSAYKGKGIRYTDEVVKLKTGKKK